MTGPRTMAVLATLLSVMLISDVFGTQPGPRGRGGPGRDPSHQADMQVFHFLLSHRKDINRTVKELPNGARTLTESNKPDVARKIQEHVQAMYRRVKEGRPIHLRDPLFREVFRHAGRIKITVEKTEKGVKVTETSKDPYVARLIHAHARVVSRFLANGYEEVRKNHPLPPREKGDE
jgi:ribosomal protein L25 (general stress protein Ctc)